MTVRGDSGGRREQGRHMDYSDGKGKTKKLLKPKLELKLHNAFAILSQPNAPTSYNMSGPALQMDDNKTIIPPDPREHRRQRKSPSNNTLSRRSGNCVIVTTCSSTTSLPLQRTNGPAWPKTTPTIRNVWQSTLPIPSVAHQALVLPNVAAMRLQLGLHIQSDNKKDQQEQACQLCHTQGSTSIHQQ
jgi:hypothetical protein